MSTATIELSDDQLITLGCACRSLPKKPAPSTSWRWRTIGVKIKGRRIKLQCMRVGGQWYTTKAWFAKFLQEQTDTALAPASAESDRTPETENRLARAGLI